VNKVGGNMPAITSLIFGKRSNNGSYLNALVNREFFNPANIAGGTRLLGGWLV